MNITEDELIKKAIEIALPLIITAIKTAPKTRGANSLIALAITGDDKNRLASKMSEDSKHPFPRDAKNIQDSDAVILVGTKTLYAGLNCGMCKKNNCAENEKDKGLCVFNTIDLGIAIGSAVSTCSDLKIDNRVMYTAGIKARDLRLLPEEYNIVIAIPLKISQKNIFFDRK